MNNTIKRTWNQGSMVNIEDLRGMTFQAESGAHTFVISAVDDNNNPITLSGTPSGTMLRPDNTDQALTCSVSGGKVYATLPAGCYDVPGRAGITIFLTSDGQKTAIYAAVVSVTRTQSGTVAPGTTASVVDLVNAIAAAVATIPASYTDLMASIAPTYSSSGLYAAGSYAWYNGKLYRCTTPITTAETWTAAHWTLANLGSDLVDLKSALNNATENLAQNAIVATGLMIGSDGKLATLTSGSAERTICIEADYNKQYRIKKSTVSVMRAGCGSSSSLPAGTQLSSYVGHASASNAELIVNTNDTDKYIYIHLFVNNDSASVKSIDVNTATLVVVQNIPVDVENLKNAFSIDGDIQGFLFEHGSISGTTGLPSTYAYAQRMRTAFLMRFDYDVTISAKDGATYSYMFPYYYNADSSFKESGTEWKKSYTIPANTYFKMVVDASYGNGAPLITDSATILSNFKYTIEFKKKILNPEIESITGYGGIFSAVMFEAGSVRSTDGVDVDYNNYTRKRTINKLNFKIPVRIRAKTIEGLSPTFGVLAWDDDGTFIGLISGDYVKNFVIPANTNVKIVMMLESANNYHSIEDTVAGFVYSPEIEKTCYLAPNGSDSNSGGDSTKPRLTIQKAIDEGFTKLVLAPGEYKGQKISTNGVSNIEMICNTNTTRTRPYETQARKATAVIDNSIDVENLVSYSSVYRTALTVDSTHTFYKVFISHELPPVYEGEQYYGQTDTYNAILWEITDDIRTCKKLVPKLSLAEVQSTNGTFYYDGSYVYVNPYDGSITDKTYKRLYDDKDTTYGVSIRNGTGIRLEGIEVDFFPYYNIYFQNCADVEVKDCFFGFTSYGSCVEVYNSSATFRSCISGCAGADGYGIVYAGNASFFDCCAYCCNDDGISHHFTSTGIIDGGEFAYNLSGGCTPAFGADVDVRNVYCHHNGYGLNFLGDSTNKTSKYVLAYNCVLVDNTTDYMGSYYNIISKGVTYKTFSFSDCIVKEYASDVLTN